jgi:N-acetylmuramic acid 6-phosphate etherase
MVLNMLTTGAMVRLGYVYGNLMVNLHQKNSKLTERAVTIVEKALGVDREQARKALSRAGNDVPVAIVMGKAGASRRLAGRSLEAAKGHVRRAIARAEARLDRG